MGHSQACGNQYSLSNKVAFDFHNTNEARLLKCHSSAVKADLAITCLQDAKSGLAEVPRNHAIVTEHRNKALAHHPYVDQLKAILNI